MEKSYKVTTEIKVGIMKALQSCETVIGVLVIVIRVLSEKSENIVL